MGAANYINQLITKLKKHIDNNTIIVGDFNTPPPFQWTDHLNRTSTSKQRFEGHTKTDGFNRYIQNTLAKTKQRIKGFECHTR